MSQRHTALASLYEELHNIQVFDRIHDCATKADPVNERAYEIRQVRRKQILDEITSLTASRPAARNAARVGRTLLLLGTTASAVLYYLLTVLSAQLTTHFHSPQ